ncbi:hypothetical protein VSDG_09727 [Cytospora chrysosperma]|uniref:Uncharacterized protein n=1 Tax=Cytospora chrysosperma TaxID=252740 RepID=A0A423VA65_CYTCH|nr:hypothetical protein VSDG_09727 [Valsa sordida]
MVPAEPLPKASISAANKQKISRRNNPRAKSAIAIRPKPQGASKTLKAQLAPPLTEEARRTITSTTERLMRRRDELDRLLLSQASRLFGRIKPADWLPRVYVLRQCQRLAKRERRHIRFRTKVLAGRTRLYKLDPSAERAIDVDLVRDLLWKFKRHLGPYLVAAENSSNDDDNVEYASSGSNSGSSRNETGVEMASTSSSGDDRHTSTDPSSVEENSEDQKPSVAGGHDGAFDDTTAPKKRKADDPMGSGKEPQKKVKKEQPAGDKQSSTSDGPSDKPIAPQISQGVEDFIAAINADAGMSQTKPFKRDADGKEKVDRKAKEATAVKTPSDNGSLIPFYKLHAKAMMDPEFNDHVHDRPPNKRRNNNNNKRPVREYNVHGAIPVPHPSGPKQRQKNNKGRLPKGRRL